MVCWCDAEVILRRASKVTWQGDTGEALAIRATEPSLMSTAHSVLLLAIASQPHPHPMQSACMSLHRRATWFQGPMFLPRGCHRLRYWEQSIFTAG